MLVVFLLACTSVLAGRLLAVDTSCYYEEVISELTSDEPVLSPADCDEEGESRWPLFAAIVFASLLITYYPLYFYPSRILRQLASVAAATDEVRRLVGVSRQSGDLSSRRDRDTAAGSDSHDVVQNSQNAEEHRGERPDSQT